jgi:hypothetical protein
MHGTIDKFSGTAAPPFAVGMHICAKFDALAIRTRSPSEENR